MDRITLKEAFKAMEDLSDDIFDAFEQPEVKVINKKSLKESKLKKILKESINENKYIGKKAIFNGYGFDDYEDYEELEDYEGEECTITGLGCEVDDDFESNYWDIEFEDGFTTEAVSGYSLDLIEDESLNEGNQLEEQLPPDLAKAYRKAPVESDKIGFTGVGAKEKRYDKNSPYLSQKDTRRNVKTDYANSEYKEITPEEALQAKKDGNIGKLRILIDGKLVQYRNDGYPLVGPELYGDKVYTKKNGEEVNDTRRMPFNHIVKIADKIYLTDEDEHSIGKGGQEFDYETRQWKDIESDSVYNKRQSNKEIEDTGKHNKEKSDNWNRKQANSYKKYIADYKDKLAKLEQKWEAGDISKNDYEAQKASIEHSIEWDTDYYDKYRKNAERDEQRIRNNKASRRYQVSANKLREPLDKLKELKRNIRWAKDELNDLEKSGLSSYRLSGGSYKEKQSEIAKLKAQIEQAQKRIEQLEKESQGLDDANAKQNADAIAKAQDKVNNIQNEINTLLRKNKNESLNLKESDESKDYNEYNAQSVLNNVEELIAKGDSYDFDDVYDMLSIFDWWPNRLTQNHLRQMRAFLKEAIKLGYDGYVCFKVGASGCANGMWAYKEPTTTGYSPDCDAIYRSFTPDYTYYAVCVDGKWYPDEETNGEPYDSCKTTRQLEELISKFNTNKNESLKENWLSFDTDKETSDKFKNFLRKENIYFESSSNGDKIHFEVQVENEDIKNKVNKFAKSFNESLQLTEAEQIDINDPEDVEKGKKLLDDNKKEDNIEEMQIVDVDANTVDKLKDSYIGNVLLQCPICRTPIFKAPDKLIKDEENIADNLEDQLYNVGEQCPHCGNEKGFNLIGQVANMNVDAEEEDEETTGEEEIEKEDNFEQTTEDEISEEPIETEEEEEDVTFESLDIDKFNNIANTYLTEVYSNVDSFTTTNATVDDENNKLVIEGIINYKSGKSKNTKFEFLGESITEDNKYIFKGLNETFVKDNDKAFTLKASINNNTLISESLDYDYTVINTKLNESKVVKGSTLKETMLDIPEKYVHHLYMDFFTKGYYDGEDEDAYLQDIYDNVKKAAQRTQLKFIKVNESEDGTLTFYLEGILEQFKQFEEDLDTYGITDITEYLDNTEDTAWGREYH